MAVLNLNELYEQYIKSRPQAERLRLIEWIAKDIAGSQPPEPTKTRSIMELHGLGAEIWKGIDAQEYVNALREEWDQRP